MSEEHARLETVFAGALEQTGAQREAYLDEACAGDPELRRQVERLMRAVERSGSFLTDDAGAATAANPALPIADGPAGAPPVPADLEAKPGDVIGRYKILERLGEGGFGIVYMAEQREPVRRKVALKIIKVGMDTKEVVARFEAERQALALMDHPNIAKILDGGATGPADSALRTPHSTISQGRPYFVMELVRGIKITDFCDQNQLGLQERLALFLKVCLAVQHAHQKGIIHRDLKPSNILVTINDGVPVPKVIDFGIAKATQQELTEKTLFTAFGQFMGTPAYMSPEQTVMTSLDIDTRSDIYSLGVLLYELLTGKPPFDTRELMKVGLDELCRTLREVEPPRPSTRLSTMAGEALASIAKFRRTDAPKLVHHVRGDLDWIVMKCLEKDRARRYETANGLAADLQRHLSNEPVVARPPSAAYRLQKLVRRNKLAFSAGAVVVASLVIGLGISLWQYVEKSAAYHKIVAAEREQDRLRQEAVDAQRTEARARRRAEVESKRNEEFAEFFKTMLRGIRPEIARGRDTTVLRELLDQTAARLYTELTNQPYTRLEIARSLAHTYEKLGEYERSEKMYRIGLAQADAIYGRSNFYTGRFLHDIAIEISKQVASNPSRLAEGEYFARASLTNAVLNFGSNGLELVLSLDMMAQFQQERGDRASAIDTWRQAVAIAEDPSSPGERFAARTDERIQVLQNLALALSDNGEFSEATNLALRALNLERSKPPGPGTDHDLANALVTTAATFVRSGDPARALPLYEESLRLVRANYPSSASELHKALIKTALTAAQAGHWPRAEQLFRECLANQRTATVTNLALLGESFDWVARILAARRNPEGVRLTREMIAFERRKYATNSPRLGLALSGDADLLNAFGEFAEAENLAREAIERIGNSLPAGHEAIGGAEAALGWALTERAWANRRAPAEAVIPAREATQVLREAIAKRGEGTNATAHRRHHVARSRLAFARVLASVLDPATGIEARAATFVDAEPEVLRTHQAIQAEHFIDQFQQRAALERVARFYELWNELVPAAGKTAPAAEWRQRLALLDRATSEEHPAGDGAAARPSRPAEP